MVLPGLEAAVDDERGGADAQHDDGAPDDPGDRGSSLGPEVGAVDGGGGAELGEQLPEAGLVGILFLVASAGIAKRHLDRQWLNDF